VLTSEDLVLCSGTIRKAPLDLTVRAAARAGFQGVSVYFDEYHAARAVGWSDRDLRTFLDDQGVAVAELDGRMRWLPDDTAGPPAGEFIKAAGALGARSITVLEVSGRVVGGELPLAHAVRSFAAVCDHAAEYDLLAHIEYFPRSGIASLRTAYDIAQNANRTNGGVMVDSWHHLRGSDAGVLDPDISGLSILAIQLGDVDPTPSADLTHEMMHGRLLPGTGAGDLTSLVRALRDRGCIAPLEVEVYSDELAALDPFTVAERAMDALQYVIIGSR
jgi:sugar phosphate isomerase/epimerase